MCREAWRRRFICGEREAPSGAMFLGSRVDDAVSLYYRWRLAGVHLDLEQVTDAYRELWQREIEAEQENLGIDWSDIHPRAASRWGWKRSSSLWNNWCQASASRSRCNGTCATPSRPGRSGRSPVTWISRLAARR
ncbi:MAG: hypothetical protein JO039_11385 [Solirubrobacterales bacterium]|nr:hypothetical protein [Solirubrobacterales bacterium]